MATPTNPAPATPSSATSGGVGSLLTPVTMQGIGSTPANLLANNPFFQMMMDAQDQATHLQRKQTPEWQSTAPGQQQGSVPGIS